MTSLDRLALLGGSRLRHRGVPPWPQTSYTARQALQAVLDSGHWWQSGNGFAEKLENWLADQFHAPAPVAVASGTLALELALAALDIGPGDEVLVPAITFIATATAVSRIGATPVPVDIAPATLLVDLDQASGAITSRTVALIVVHLAGSAVDLATARAWCDSRGLALVEDSAQAVTAAVDDQRVGTIGDAAILSFQAAKLLPGGDGGAVITRDQQTSRRVELLANNGRPRGSTSYSHTLIGTNARISEFSAALALAATRDYEQMQTRRDRTARLLDTSLRRVVPDSVLDVLIGTTRRDHYMVLLRRPATLRKAGITTTTVVAALTAEGLPARTIFPAWHTTPAFNTTRQRESCPAARYAADDVIWFHHPLLLDPSLASDLPQALTKLIRHVDQLSAWQQQCRGGPDMTSADRIPVEVGSLDYENS